MIRSELRSLSQTRATRTLRRQVTFLAALVALPLSVGLAAFGTTPGTQVEPISIERIVAELPIAPVAPLVTAGSPEVYTYVDQIKSGDTVAALLHRLRVDDADAVDFIRSDKAAKAIFRQLVPGKTVVARVNGEGDLVSLAYRMSGDAVSRIERRGDGYRVMEDPVEVGKGIAYRAGTIGSSLFGATDAAGVPDAVATQFARVFSTETDFHKDLRRGDSFAVVYEVLSDGVGPPKAGRLLAAEFVNQGDVHRVVYYEGPAAAAGYYTAEGRSLRAAFLRSPIEFTRVTSGFSLSRFHPLLHKWRAHKGVDFGAPSGTRVLATGEGTVQFRGQRHGYGNVVELHHRGGYTTVYGHLSRFAEELRVGDTVEQGETIGYVGMTGLATGPHLHYEFRVAGVCRDPQGTELPVVLPADPHFRALFARASAPLVAGLDIAQTGAAAVHFE